MEKKIYSYLLIIITLLLTTSFIFSQSFRKAPYLIYNGNPSEVQVIWQLNSTADCTIDWGTDTLYSLGSAQTSEYGNDHQHLYTIENLEPFTKYYYRVSTGQTTNNGSFHSAPDSNANNLKFFAYGDTRSNPGIHNQVAAEIISVFNEDQNLQTFILATGDLVYHGDNEQDWDGQFFNPSYPNIKEMLASLQFQTCMGNHEDSGQLFVKYFPYPFISNRYWSFDYGPAHFVIIDQYTSYGPGSAELEWIENDLAASTKKWKFISLHEPGWSAGHHGNNSTVQNYIQPLCEQYGVSIVFGGHNHYYARADVNGVQHITTGGGGAPLYQPNLNYPNIVTATMAHHFCKVEINDNTLHFTAITSSGEVIDTFTISKSNSPPVITSQPDTLAYVDSLYQYQVVAGDINGDSLTFSLTIAPQWLSIDSALGLIQGTPAVADVGDTVVAIRVDDGQGGTDTQSYNLHVSNLVGIHTELPNLPQMFALYQNYPNPFNPATVIKYSIAEDAIVKIKVYDILGIEVAELVNQSLPAGNYEINFKTDNLASGIYIYRLVAIKNSKVRFTDSKHMMLLK